MGFKGSFYRNYLRMKKTALIICVLLGINCSCENFSVKPNIVFILIDDMGWTDVGYMGSKYYETPNIDRLAKNGMIFTQAYANASNCAPTRACLLSGQYSPRHGIFTVGTSERGKSKDRRIIPVENKTKISLNKITIAEALKPAGYVSAAIGKWHIGHTPREQGFDVGMDRDALGYPRGHFKDDGEYLTDRLTDEAIKFIRENKENPFFLYLAHHAVHTPIQAKDDIIDKYKEKRPDGCHDNKTYAAMIQSVDESVARVNHILEELGLSKSTLLIFFSDNGGHGTYTCQDPLRGGKGMYYEGGIREPMFAYWPGKIKAGSSCDLPVISTDFYPTFLELAGISKTVNYPLDGESLVSLLKREGSLKRESIFWHFPAYLEAYKGLKDHSRDTVFRTRPVSVIRKGDWKLLMFHEEWMLDGGYEKISENTSVELYNLKTDLAENNNLCNTEVEKRNELLEELIQWQDEIQAPISTEPNPQYRR